jgi:vacuolar-type H+-ATPase subunit H
MMRHSYTDIADKQGRSFDEPRQTRRAIISGMTDELDPREAERLRRRDREAEAEQRDLMRSGMGKVFKQIQDAQAKAAKVPPKRRRRTPG